LSFVHIEIMLPDARPFVQHVIRSLMVIGKKYITVESHRDRLAEEKSAALNDVDELKKKLATLE